MKRPLASALQLAAIALLAACSPEKVSLDPAREAGVRAAARPIERPNSARRAHLPTLAAREGRVTAAQPLEVGQTLPADQQVQLDDGGLLVLHFPGGATLRVAGKGSALVAPDGNEAVLLHDGIVAVDLERAAARVDSGYWLATPAARVELTRGARLGAAALPDGTTRVVVVSGQLELWTAGEPPVSRALVAGQSADVEPGGAPRVLNHAGLTLEQAEQSLRAFRGRAPASTGAARPLDPGALEAASERVLRNRAREQELLARHRGQRAQRAAGRALDGGLMEAQRALAEHAAQSFQALRALRVRLSLFEAAALGESSAFAPQIARARELAR